MTHPRDGESRAVEGPPELRPDFQLTTATNGIAPQHNGCPASPGSAEWRPIPDWPGYECTPVPPPGRVRSVDRFIECRNGTTKFYRGVVLATSRGKVQLSVMSYRRAYTVRSIVRRAWGEVAA